MEENLKEKLFKDSKTGWEELNNEERETINNFSVV